MGELAHVGVDILADKLTAKQKKYNHTMLKAITQLADEHNKDCMSILFDNMYLRLEKKLCNQQTTQLINYVCSVADTYNTIKHPTAINTQQAFQHYLHS